MAALWNNYGVYLWLLTAVGLIVVCGVTFRLGRQLRVAIARYTTLTNGVEGSQLEDIWQARSQQIARHEDALALLQEQVSQLGQESVQHVGLVRFNPFGDVGGDQSFAVALLNGNRSGIVISSIYSRAGVRTYAKPVQAGMSSHTLSDEEEAAIAQATASLTTALTPN